MSNFGLANVKIPRVSENVFDIFFPVQNLNVGTWKKIWIAVKGTVEDRIGVRKGHAKKKPNLRGKKRKWGKKCLVREESIFVFRPFNVREIKLTNLSLSFWKMNGKKRVWWEKGVESRVEDVAADYFGIPDTSLYFRRACRKMEFVPFTSPVTGIFMFIWSGKRSNLFIVRRQKKVPGSDKFKTDISPSARKTNLDVSPEIGQSLCEV